MSCLFKEYKDTPGLYNIIDKYLNAAFPNIGKSQNYKQEILSFFKFKYQPNVHAFCLGVKAWLSTIRCKLKQSSLMFLPTKHKEKADFDHIVYLKIGKINLKPVKQETLKYKYNLSKNYFNTLIYNVTLLILLADSVHKLSVENYTKEDKYSKFEMFFVDYLLHHLISHILECILTYECFDNIIIREFSFFTTIFSLDFSLYNEFLKFKESFAANDLELGLINYFPFETNLSDKKEINDIYNNWNKHNKFRFKHKVFSRKTLNSFFAENTFLNISLPKESLDMFKTNLRAEFDRKKEGLKVCCLTCSKEKV
ncbi:hypothetical protein EHP00_790 [Ecytonucleospora hepatopenaei]|uniref:Uncharacterized protein n=1 Tax=Ecytonucleospora hepatopenaei TaxID=646526 RepID=A0A1W0E7W6_9MICR|nr:hypothetical protein EHP00_790 [Ecytonucleospora hepatopenaei]